jgi:hypothetical protein
MKKNGRGRKSLDVGQPAPGAREPCEVVERGDELPSEFQAKRDGWEAFMMKGYHEVIVEVKNADPVATPNSHTLGELHDSVTTPDLHTGR